MSTCSNPLTSSGLALSFPPPPPPPLLNLLPSKLMALHPTTSLCPSPSPPLVLPPPNLLLLLPPPPTGDIGYLSSAIGCHSLIFRETPADYCYSWHCAPRRQFIVNLDADLEVEVSSGEKRVIKQGDVFFVEDTTGWISTAAHAHDLYNIDMSTFVSYWVVTV